MQIEDVKGCCEKTLGMSDVARTRSKARLHAAGKLALSDRAGEEILIYNSSMSKRGWRDDETDEFIPSKIKECGIADRAGAVTGLDLMEIVEGRRHPAMWRGAWK